MSANKYVNVTDDETLIKQLEALRQTISDEEQNIFWAALNKLQDIEAVFRNLTLMTWGWYFPPSCVDSHGIASRIFLILSRIVYSQDPAPNCPQCNGPMKFSRHASKPFGWLYVCAADKWVSRRDERAKKGNVTKQCKGTVSATTNSWIENSKAPYEGLFLTFAWVS